jgi:hypothetical protein
LGGEVVLPGLAPAARSPQVSLLRAAGRGCPAATHFSLLRQRKVSKRKATLVAASPALRSGATCGARSSRGLAKLATLRFAQTTPALIRLALRSSAHPQGVRIKNTKQPKTETRIPETTRTRHGVSLFVFVPAPVPDCPLWMRRGAQVQADQGSRCLSEASLARPRLNRAPQVARSEAKGRRSQGRLFFGDFLLAKQKKVTGRRATPGQQLSAENREASPCSQ